LCSKPKHLKLEHSLHSTLMLPVRLTIPQWRCSHALWPPQPGFCSEVTVPWHQNTPTHQQDPRGMFVLSGPLQSWTHIWIPRRGHTAVLNTYTKHSGN
jgi:hypothetical protein